MDIQSPAPSSCSSVPWHREGKSKGKCHQPQEDRHTAQVSSLPGGGCVYISCWEWLWPMTSFEPVLFSTGQNCVREPAERCGQLQDRAQAKELLREV